MIRDLTFALDYYLVFFALKGVSAVGSIFLSSVIFDIFYLQYFSIFLFSLCSVLCDPCRLRYILVSHWSQPSHFIRNRRGKLPGYGLCDTNSNRGERLCYVGFPGDCTARLVPIQLSSYTFSTFYSFLTRDVILLNMLLVTTTKSVADESAWVVLVSLP